MGKLVQENLAGELTSSPVGISLFENQQELEDQLAPWEEPDQLLASTPVSGDSTQLEMSPDMPEPALIPGAVISNQDWTPDPPQPQNSKRVTDQSRRFDQTQLREAGYGYSVHRDYAAHFFRWGHAKRFIKRGSYVLDVGCGQDQPLAHVLASGSGGNVPEIMIAVDYNKITKPFSPSWLITKDKFDFVNNYKELCDPALEFDVVTCFEVIEHMHTCDAPKLLQGMYYWLAQDGIALLSTPVFNGRAAANHIHEYTIPELQEYIEAAGFKVINRYGTFASYNDIKRGAQPQHVQLLDQLKEYYDGDVAACFLAPMNPGLSRNNCWILKVA